MGQRSWGTPRMSPNSQSGCGLEAAAHCFVLMVLREALLCTRYRFLLSFNILNSQAVFGFGFQVFESRAFSCLCVVTKSAHVLHGGRAAICTDML